MRSRTCDLLVAAWVLIVAPTTQALPVDVLVNKAHPLPHNYVPSDLVTPPVFYAYSYPPENQLSAGAAAALTRMFTAAHRANIELVLSSGYRSYADQAALYATIQPDLVGDTSETVARAGQSEHQTGLAADIITADYTCAAQTCFMLTKAYGWLQAHAADYGFIMRYPYGEDAVTGYSYEPWHYRYVGVHLARQLAKSHQTLEQYYASKNT